MDTEELLAKLHGMTIEEKLALLSDTDKAYLRGYLDRVTLEFHTARQGQGILREAALPKEPGKKTGAAQ